MPPVQDQTQSSIELTTESISESVEDDPIIDWIIGPTNANATPPPPSNAPRIPRVPQTVRDKHDYEKYFAPKIVSIGPYHFGEPKLQLFEKRKPDFAMKLLSNNRAALKSLYEKLRKPEMVNDLRSFYEEKSTIMYSDKEFTKMMLLDGCFILYFSCSIYLEWIEECNEFKSNETFSIRRDLFLLENQIPFKVLKQVMKLAQTTDHFTRFKHVDLLEYFIEEFIDKSSFVLRIEPKRKWWLHMLRIIHSNEESGKALPDHLLGILHGKHSTTVETQTDNFNFSGCNFRSVNELVQGGIRFKPIKDTLSMTHIEFHKGWWGLSANVKLPPIVVSDFSRPMLLNLMAYETCQFSLNDSWVKSYVYLLNSLIDDAEDVKILRKAWVLDNLLASDQGVVDLFNEIAIDLVENGSKYWEAKHRIQKHYESWKNTLFTQLKNEYVKSPWAFLALVGALIALFLTGVQTYYAVWSPKSTCEDLCVFLKMNHHL